MRNLSGGLLAFALVSSASCAWANESIIEIIAPKDGAEVKIDLPVVLEYKVVLAGKGDRILISLDGQKVILLRRTQGTFNLDKVPLGAHDICIDVVDKKRNPTGDQQCVQILGRVNKGWR